MRKQLSLPVLHFIRKLLMASSLRNFSFLRNTIWKKIEFISIIEKRCLLLNKQDNRLTLLRKDITRVFVGDTSVCVEVIINTVITVGWTPTPALAILRQTNGHFRHGEGRE